MKRAIIFCLLGLLMLNCPSNAKIKCASTGIKRIANIGGHIIVQPKTPSNLSFEASNVWVYLDRKAYGTAYVVRKIKDTAIDVPGAIRLYPGDYRLLTGVDGITEVKIYKSNTSDTLYYQLSECDEANITLGSTSIDESNVFRFGESYIDSTTTDEMVIDYSELMNRPGYFNYVYISVDAAAVGSVSVKYYWGDLLLRTLLLHAGGSVADNVACTKLKVKKTVGSDKIMFGAYAAR